MFTNWLTATNTANAQNRRDHQNHHQQHHHHHHHHQTKADHGNVHLQDIFTKYRNSDLSSTPATSHHPAAPPDVLLEVGPSPSQVRFMAHSLVLGMHSGYLRSAIRLDESAAAAAAVTATAAASAAAVARLLESTQATPQQQQQQSASNFVLYLDNVTAEQFAPLLTYMYTGYLELTIENIFGVLLATHVLHMPRALEICRSFLARLQSEGYFCGSNLSTTTTASTGAPPAVIGRIAEEDMHLPKGNHNGRIIRPIPSKATTTPIVPGGYCYLAPPPPQQQQQHHPFQSPQPPPLAGSTGFSCHLLGRTTAAAILPPSPPLPAVTCHRGTLEAKAQCSHETAGETHQQMSRQPHRRRDNSQQHRQRTFEIDVVADDDDDDHNEESHAEAECDFRSPPSSSSPSLSPLTSSVALCAATARSSNGNAIVIAALQSDEEEISIDNNETDMQEEIDCDISVTSSPHTINNNNNTGNSEGPLRITQDESLTMTTISPPDNNKHTSNDDNIASTSNNAAKQMFRSVERATTPPPREEKKSKLLAAKRQPTERKKPKKSGATSTTTTANRSNGRQKVRENWQVAQPPIPASQLHQHHEQQQHQIAIAEVEPTPTAAATTKAADNIAPKFIIDVASCDGPVRFRRILNAAYGQNNQPAHQPPTGGSGGILPQPANFAAITTTGVTTNLTPPTIERTQQSVSLSFHQQMAKKISQQQEQKRQHADESENSEGSAGSQGDCVRNSSAGRCRSRNTAMLPRLGGEQRQKSAAAHELYVCVYCKHTFKSQYCYQKHAKRHLNPLSVNCTTTTTSGAADRRHLAADNGNSTDMDQDPSEQQHCANNSSNNNSDANILTVRKLLAATPALAQQQQPAAASVLMRRDMRPLDMNVQYYPCKTCGSKFPSYYFVHKHRKMCHANEEATANATLTADDDDDAAISGLEAHSLPANSDETEIASERTEAIKRRKS